MTTLHRDTEASSLVYDDDTGTLDVRLVCGTEFRILNAGHARAIYEKIPPGGRITAAQREWLEPFRVATRVDRRDRLRLLLKSLRQELRMRHPQ